MSTIIVHAQGFSPTAALALVLGLALVMLAALLILFKPLLRGLARAALLAFKPRLGRQERLRRGHALELMALQRTLNSADGAPSHTAELRAIIARA